MEIRRIQVAGPDGDYGLSYADWGRPDAARTIVCVHGLTRNGRDFDHLATALQDHARVICPDMVGRGLSDPLRDPEVAQGVAHVVLGRAQTRRELVGALREARHVGEQPPNAPDEHERDGRQPDERGGREDVHPPGMLATPRGGDKPGGVPRLRGRTAVSPHEHRRPAPSGASRRGRQKPAQ